MLSEHIYLVMAIANFLSLVLGGGVIYGKLAQKNKEIEKDIFEAEKEIKAIKHWGESEIERVLSEGNKLFIRKDVFNECILDIKRRLDEVNTIDINSRLARIEAMLDNIQIILDKR